jgi:Transposase and inactivated derivatives
MDERMTKELCLKVVQAITISGPKEAVLHHSDRGSQYASSDYQACLRQYGMTGSISRKGNCYENACIESFHRVLKKSLFTCTNSKPGKKSRRRFLSTLRVFTMEK